MLAVKLEGGGALPELHFSNAVNGRNPAAIINLQIKAGGILRGSAQLKGGILLRRRRIRHEIYGVSCIWIGPG